MFPQSREESARGRGYVESCTPDWQWWGNGFLAKPRRERERRRPRSSRAPRCRDAACEGLDSRSGFYRPQTDAVNRRGDDRAQFLEKPGTLAADGTHSARGYVVGRKQSAVMARCLRDLPAAAPRCRTPSQRNFLPLRIWCRSDQQVWCTDSPMRAPLFHLHGRVMDWARGKCAAGCRKTWCGVRLEALAEALRFGQPRSIRRPNSPRSASTGAATGRGRISMRRGGGWIMSSRTAVARRVRCVSCTLRDRRSAGGRRSDRIHNDGRPHSAWRAAPHEALTNERNKCP